MDEFALAALHRHVHSKAGDECLKNLGLSYENDLITEHFGGSLQVF